jgi:flagellar hook-basal body complex protein FliE
MSGIPSISGGLTPYLPVSSPDAGRPSQAVGGGAGRAAGGFGEALKAYASAANDDQQASGLAIQDLVSGSNGDVLPAVAAVAKADMSFKLLIGVRNKVIEAYKQTISMQI